MRVIDVMVQNISIVFVRSSRLQYKPPAGRLVCQTLSESFPLLTPPPKAWIAHGILDSVVDSFFPLVEEIGEQVVANESAVYNEDTPASTIAPIPLVNSRKLQAIPVAEKVVPLPSAVDEKHVTLDVASVKTAKTQFSLPRLTCGLMLWRLRRTLWRLLTCCMRSKRNMEPSFTLTALGLHRMARTRRLTTSVARVLATKPEVVAGIRKRLLTSDGPATSDDAEVAIYFGDVQGEIGVDRSVWRVN
jgi:magnesium transporter